MAQYDVHEWLGGGDVDYVVDVQSDLLSGVVTRVVIPLRSLESGEKPICVLNPVLNVAAGPYSLSTAELSGVRVTDLGNVVTNVAHAHDDILAALDLLFTGI